MTIEIDFLKQTAIAAGEKIIEIYGDTELSEVVDYKADDSPLTIADKASHNIIVEALKSQYQNIPIVSEEGVIPSYSERAQYDRYWLIDPLDGTKEFINRNGEFTVNIALIENNKSTIGLVYAPVLEALYWGFKGEAYKEVSGEVIRINANNSQKDRIAVRSKSHASVEEEEVLNKYNVIDSISVGSSLKFCMVAEGKADIYYRHGPTMEWDTAAGHAVLNAAGGAVYKGISYEEFEYNKENLLNGSFLALGFSR